MGNNSGLFVRHYMGQTPTSGGDGWSASPDIVLNGAASLTAAELATLGTTGYTKDFGSTVLLGQQNYVYLRAQNTTGAAVKGRAWFFYTESDLVLWPGKWRGDKVQVGGFDTNFQDLAAEAGAVGATQHPFLWTPPDFPPGHSGGDHYCCVFWGENPQVNPPVSPISGFPNFNTCQELVAFIVSHPNLGWRNTQDIVANQPTRQWSMAITGPAKEGQFSVGIQCSNMPAKDGGQVSFTIPGLVDPLTMPISNPNMGVIIPVDWPASQATVMNITYWQGKTIPPAGATIAPVVVMPSTQLSEQVMALARTNTPYRVRMFDVIEPGQASRGRRAGSSGSQGASPARIVGGNLPGVIFGSTPLRFPGP